jgi:hypothetical protein
MMFSESKWPVCILSWKWWFNNVCLYMFSESKWSFWMLNQSRADDSIMSVSTCFQRVSDHSGCSTEVELMIWWCIHSQYVSDHSECSAEAEDLMISVHILRMWSFQILNWSGADDLCLYMLSVCKWSFWILSWSEADDLMMSSASK